MITKACSIYVRSGQLYIFTQLFTDYGLVTQVPASILGSDSEQKLIGEKILSALADSNFVRDISLAESGKEFRVYLGDLGYKTWSAFARGAKLLAVHLENGRVRIAARKYDGQGNFVPSDISDVECDVDPEFVGRLAVEQMSRIQA